MVSGTDRMLFWAEASAGNAITSVASRTASLPVRVRPFTGCLIELSSCRDAVACWPITSSSGMVHPRGSHQNFALTLRCVAGGS
jgi:hypothetical protein